MNDLLYRFGVAVGIGFLIGLQREFASGRDHGQLKFAGVRTFTLLGLAGAAAAYTGDLTGSLWVLVGAMFLVGSLLVTSYWVAARSGDVGMTTEMAAVIVFLAGIISYYRQVEIAVAIGVVLLLVLSLKVELHRFAQRLTREDLIAIVKFGVITAIILPVLPNRGIGPPPFDMLNPYRVWLMVVLISGLSFLGYGLAKIVGPRRGIGLTGLLGGMASSTAVTLAFTQRSKSPGAGPLVRAFGAAVVVAWAVMFIRVLAEVAITNGALLRYLWLPMITNGALLRYLWLPMTTAAVVAFGYGLFTYRRLDDEGWEEVPMAANPFELGPAIRFGLLYAIILVVARLAQEYLGQGGILASSVVAGLADVDAITLTMAELSQPGGAVPLSTAGHAVTLAALANTSVKAVIVVIGGTAALRKTVLPGFGLILLAGLAANLLR
jgi:uncharacterized membrane protein (DUF4010 family)